MRIVVADRPCTGVLAGAPTLDATIGRGGWRASAEHPPHDRTLHAHPAPARKWQHEATMLPGPTVASARRGPGAASGGSPVHCPDHGQMTSPLRSATSADRS
jgi:hypothetical protein